VDAALLAALAEPNRLRIVELLYRAPRPVGEIAAELALRQPQVTKHLQTLERVGLVRVYALGQRRIYTLLPDRLAELSRWAAGLARTHPSEDALVRYRDAIAAETSRLATDRTARTVRIRRTVPAPAAAVWAAWTDADRVRRWWSPQHFSVADCVVDARAGGELVIVLAEGDGSRHPARGRFVEVHPFDRLAFELAPVDAADQPLFQARHTVRLEAAGERTVVHFRVRASEPRPEAAPALAGLRIGWEQTLDKLAALFG
jgi:uncharacterized protein YndB with AHSA1/START domain/DNA-binding transcriptional ArsR family regulator